VCFTTLECMYRTACRAATGVVLDIAQVETTQMNVLQRI